MTARLATAGLLVVACLVMWSATTARNDTTRVIGLCLAAALIVWDVGFAVSWLSTHGGRW